jgi:hypothetical protein
MQDARNDGRFRAWCVVWDQDIGEVLRNVSHGGGSHLSFIRYVDMDSSDFSQMYRKSRSNGDSENNADPHTPRGGSFMYLFSDRSSSPRAIAGCRECLPVPREIAISTLLISARKCVHFSVELCTLTGGPRDVHCISEKPHGCWVPRRNRRLHQMHLRIAFYRPYGMAGTACAGLTCIHSSAAPPLIQRCGREKSNLPQTRLNGGRKPRLFCRYSYISLVLCFWGHWGRHRGII